jgi:hypothetical protein
MHRGRAGLLAGVCLIALAGATPAHAAHHHHNPGLRVAIVSSSQKTILKKRRIAVQILATKRGSLARVFASFRRRGKKTPSVVATRIRELKVRRGHPRRVSLKLTRSGRRALGGCVRGRIVVTAAPIRKRAGKPGKRVRKRSKLRRDQRLCKHGRKGGSGGGGGSKGSGPGKPIDYQTPLDFDRCDFLDGADCLLPFPNDWFTTSDATTDTNRRVNLNILSMPRNTAGKPIDPSAWNRSDGFSPGDPIVTKVPGLDTKAALDRTGIVPIDDMARAFDRNQPAVLINARTRARQLVWAEVDANPQNPADRTLVIRPGKNLQEGTRYIVALRRMRDASGKLIPANQQFRLYRDGQRTTNSSVESRRDHFESMFQTLAQAGIDRSDLYRAWDFTVASERNLSERMLFMRNDAFKQLGDTNLADMKVQGSAPKFTVTKVTDFTKAQNDRIARQVEGTYTVPCYLDAPGCPSGSRFLFDETKTNGPPTPLPGNTMQARFTCNIPWSAKGGPPARASLYGHGLFGSRDEVNQSQLRSMANEHNFVFCATDWIGMACTDVPTSAGDFQGLIEDTLAGHPHNPPDCDVPNAFTLEADLSKFPELADRVQQAMLNFLYLGRLMIHADGFDSDPAFKVDAAGKGAIDRTRLFYDGNSQGGIVGGALIAIFVDGDRGVIGVPGMNYSTLLQRSTDFGTGQPPHPDPTDPESVIPEYAYPLYQSYPNQVQRQLILSLMQMLWDRAEADGYALHMTSDPYPNTPAHRVLMHAGLGDHQVAQIAAETEARTIGARAHFPWADPGRDLDKGSPIYGVPPIAHYPFGGSAIVLWDIGPPRKIGKDQFGTPPPPNSNTPPSEQYQDPHEFPRKQPAARQQKSDFLKIGGAIFEVCPSHPCRADPTL